MREGSVDVVPEVFKGASGRWTERNAFVGHVARQDSHALHSPGGELLAGALFDE